ncbi:unnamed protein product [Phyllotreta striolata]|uniref:F-box/LRR-repeat protein 7 n=1 Tax=Phyllotreta striolata TaxID=444603 RepID=A0A9N9TFZ7_PHYSR|nr:unnamed protein product [Phyllotreta striolata]
MNQRPESSEQLSTCPLVRLGQNSDKQPAQINSDNLPTYIRENFSYHPLYIDTYSQNDDKKFKHKQAVEKAQPFNYVQNYYLPNTYNSQSNNHSPYSYKDSLREYYWDEDKRKKIINIQSPNESVYNISSQQDTNCLLDNFTMLGKTSPSLDQGYHTLVTPNQDFWNTHLYKGKKCQSKNNSFDRLPDELVVKIFSFLSSVDLSLCAQVCRRFDILAWTPTLWRIITIEDDHVSGDKAIRCVLRQLCGQGKTGACPNVERIHITSGAKLSEKSLLLLARRCPELTHLQLHACTNLTNSIIHEIVTRCTNLQHLDITGCTKISCINITNDIQSTRKLQLQYLDLSDCVALQDNGLLIIVRNSPLLSYLYLRRCVEITDAGLKYVPSFCSGLRELSVSDCSNITDFGLYELAKLGATLRYLSVAKCDQVSDAGLKVIAKKCYKLRYLNARGCEAVSDDAINILARSCTRLRALDIGKCDVSDAGLRSLAESCPNLKKLSLRNCDLVTDRGVQCIAYYCRGLQQLNIQDCQISIDGYRAVKKYCKRCVIEHTNPGFF